jgi:TetR/AcrR family transcriptional regulator, mexJK operon transcriptional repressor
MSDSREPRRSSPRDAVERAARELFIERGFDGVSVDEIARRAGVSKPTIYAHFGDKAGLFTYILEGACARLLAPIVDPTAEQRPIAEVLVDLAYSYTRTVLAPDVLSLHRLFMAEAERFPDLSRRYYAAGPETAHRALAAFLKARSELGEIACANPMMAAEQFAGLVLGPMRLKLLFAVERSPDWDVVDAYSREAIALFLTGVVGGRRQMSWRRAGRRLSRA